MLRSDREKREKVELAVSFGWKIGLALSVMNKAELLPSHSRHQSAANTPRSSLSLEATPR